MRVLRETAAGTDVIAWQNFLRGIQPMSQVVVSGVFDALTVDETKAFQRACALDDDGVVGPMTYASAFKLGFNPLADDSTDERSVNWPPMPPLPFTSITNAMREALFGKFAFIPAPTHASPENITITDSWATHNIITAHVPQLAKIAGSGNSEKVSFHRLAAPQLVKLFADWEAHGLIDRVLTWGGAWAPRFVRGSRSYLSNHAWGTAFDINVQWNGLGARPALKGDKGSVRELVQLANENGFWWGGHWKDRPDGMHFEIAEVK